MFFEKILINLFFDTSITIFRIMNTSIYSKCNSVVLKEIISILAKYDIAEWSKNFNNKSCLFRQLLLLQLCHSKSASQRLLLYHFKFPINKTD